MKATFTTAWQAGIYRQESLGGWETVPATAANPTTEALKATNPVVTSTLTHTHSGRVRLWTNGCIEAAATWSFEPASG